MSGTSKCGGGGGYVVVRGVRPNALQGAQGSVAGTFSIATTESSATSTRDVAWINGAG